MGNQEIESFLRHLVVERGAAANTVSAYRRDLAQWHDITGGDLTVGGIEKFLINLHSQGNKSASINRKKAALSAFARYLVGEGVLTQNPVSLG